MKKAIFKADHNSLDCLVDFYKETSPRHVRCLTSNVSLLPWTSLQVFSTVLLVRVIVKDTQKARDVFGHLKSLLHGYPAFPVVLLFCSVLLLRSVSVLTWSFLF